MTAIKYYTLRKDVPLQPGQVVHFTKGKGYFAYPPTVVSNAVTPPKPPTAYTVPAGATILKPGDNGDITINGYVCAPALGKSTIGNVTYGPNGGTLQGAIVNGVVNITQVGDGRPRTLLDCAIHAGGAANGVYVYRPELLWIERVTIDGFVNIGIRADSNNMADDSRIKRLWDISTDGGNSQGASDGTGEAGLWIGHMVTDGVQRISAKGAYICAIWRGNNHHDTAWEDIYAENLVGPGTAWYDEHQTTGCTVVRYHMKSEPGGTRAYQAEYAKNFPAGAVKDCSFDQGIVEGGLTGMNIEDAQNVKVTDTRFVGQKDIGILFMRSTYTESGNDFSGMLPGAKPIVVE